VFGRTDRANQPQDVKRRKVHRTTQHMWALILALARNIAVDDLVAKTQPGGWQTDMAVNLTRKTLGIVGLGKLGAAVAQVSMLA